MALVMIDGLDHYTAAQATTKGWNIAFSSMVAGRFGGQAGRCGGNTTQYRKTFSGGTTYATIIVGFAFRTSANPVGGWGSNNAFVIQTSANAFVLTMNADASGHLVIKNNGGTTIATGTTVLSANTWYFIEIKLFVNVGTPASGTVEVQLNGVSEIASTAGNFGSTLPDRFSGLGLNGNTDFDDIYAVDTTGSTNNTFLGDCRVATVMPTGAGAHTDFQPNGAASNYQCVDETTPNDDTDYVSDANPGDIDTYDFTAIDGGATVFGVQNNLYARKDDANTRQIASVVRQSSTDYVGATKTLSSSYLYYSQLYDQDPTSSNWTAINVNADEFGVKEIA